VHSRTRPNLIPLILEQTPLQTARPKLDIPVPQINNVEGYERDVPDDYKSPRSYVRYHKPSPEDLDKTLEYIADVEDEAWLRNNNKFGGACQPKEGSEEASLLPRPHLTLRLLEHMLDLLEKETGYEAIITSGQAEKTFLSKIPQLFHMFPNKARQGVVTTKHVINDVYSYWVQKRSKLKRPLLRRFWPVTSSDDTNPHLVFRPREKEKYKLRKKRQNDMEAYRKMKQLRNDFDNLRAVLELVHHREELSRSQVQLQMDLFQQRLHDIVDTSGRPCLSEHVRKDELKRVQDFPVHFDVQYGGRKAKRLRQPHEVAVSAAAASNLMTRGSLTTIDLTSNTGDGGGGAAPNVVAGKNHGEPAPLFLHPLRTRETYATSWEGAVPHITTYIDSHAEPTFRFRHRPRVGRGGRLCIDRLPQPTHPTITPVTVFRAGHGMPRSLKPKKYLLDLLPDPLDKKTLSRRIEDLSVLAIKEDFQSRAIAASTGGDPEENDGDEVIVRLDEWLETDDQLWGEERFAIGPI